ncbi:MAG: RagB/SusD family nutrient uptake outer membrane protein [Bacteroidota bacterium]
MKLVIYILQIFIIISVLLTTSCDDDFLETKPRNEYSEADVWEDPVLTETFVNMLYKRMDDPLTQRAEPTFCDEAHRWNRGGHRAFNAGNITADGIPEWPNKRAKLHWTWDNLYTSIRATNLFFENIDRVDFEDDLTLKDEMTGEVYFFRAWYHFVLARMYGGVPIIDKVFQLDDDLEIPRDPFEDVIAFIVDDLDNAANLLPEVARDDGRVTKGAALALKSRVLITAASDLFNTNVFPDYPHPELMGYTDKSSSARRARWQAAKDAAKEVMDMGLYSLWEGSNDSISLNFVEYFTSISKHPEEDILVRYITSERANYGNWVGFVNGPPGWRGQGNTAPTGNHIDKYEMRDGTKFDWNNPEHKADPYKNRDPRFYADILYEEAYWQPRPSDFATIDPIGVVQVGIYERWDPNSESVKTEYGLDNRNNPLIRFGSETNYYERKFIDPAITHEYEIQPITFRYFRYTEILFNYAEACIELGQDAEARTYLNMIRERAGMPGFTESGDELRQRYRNEKSVEMFLESQRFWDIRRWAIGPEAYSPVLTAEVIYPLKPDNTTATVPEVRHKELNEHPKRVWLDNNKQYFFPILRNELEKNTLLIQNPGY